MADAQVYQGAACFRQRVVFATLSGKRLRIENIRSEDENTGVTDYEVAFLKLITDLSNGATVDINETGTIVKYKPGVIAGGPVHVDCGLERGIGYFVEGVLPMLPFAKKAVMATFKGVTDCNHDPSADYLRDIMLPSVVPFGLTGLAMKIKARGAPPLGGGTVMLTCPVLRELKPIDLCEAGFVKRVRGVAYCTKVSPQMANRMVDGARALLNKFIPDVYIHTDSNKGSSGGLSPGFGITLCAQSTSGVNLGCQVMANPASMSAGGAAISAKSLAAAGAAAGSINSKGNTTGLSDVPNRPEELGALASELLCEAIAGDGCVDTCSAPLVLTLMALCPEDVSRVRLPAHLSHFSVETLRLIKEFFGIVFKLKVDEAANSTILASCLGVGYKNYSKKVT